MAAQEKKDHFTMIDISEKEIQEAMEICASIFYNEMNSNGYNHTKYIGIKSSIKNALKTHSIESFRYMQKKITREYKQHYGEYNFKPNMLLSWLEQIEKEIKEENYKNNEVILKKTPTFTLIPEIINEDKRAIPNVFLRSALFGIVKPGKRSIVENVRIPSMSQYEVFHTGYQLDQNDLKVWDSLAYLARKHNVLEELRISMYELCNFMGYSISKTNYERVKARIKRLQLTQIQIKYNKKEYVGGLIHDYAIDEKSGRIIINFNKNLMSIFSTKDFTLAEERIKKHLGDNQIASWLFHFYETHETPIPFKIDFLKELCGSDTDIRDFRRKLKESLMLIKQASERNHIYFQYEIKDDQVLVSKKETLPLTLFDNPMID